MIEQKLFFTRNGEYTMWEKINLIKEEDLNFLMKYIEETMNIDLNDSKFLNSSKERMIFTIYKLKTVNSRELENLIDQYFSVNNIEKSDFNASLFRIDLSYININIGYIELQDLMKKNDEYGVDNISTCVFLRKDINCIDIRLSSIKINDYKDNDNEQFVNTEVRIYFNFGFILMTDFNEYTHTKTVKTKLIQNIKNLLTDMCQDVLPYTLSDIALRVLLKKSKKYASKFKFSIDDYINVDFNIIYNIGDDPLQHAGLREFYDKHPISLIKISMNSNEEKYITIDGERGKLICRSKSMEVKDIDEFIYLLKDVIKYDYLNVNYIKQIKLIAKRKLVGPSLTKISQVDGIYIEIIKNIVTFLGDNNDVDTISITRNAFIYCLINNIIINNNIQIKFKLDERVVKLLSKLLEQDKENIYMLFDYIMNLAINNNDNILEVFDEFINLKSERNVSQI